MKNDIRKNIKIRSIKVESIKKAGICGLAVACMFFAAGCGANGSVNGYNAAGTTHYIQGTNTAQNGTGTAAGSTAAVIDTDAAQAAALSHAGLMASDVTFVKCELDCDYDHHHHNHGHHQSNDCQGQIYDIEFCTDTMEYEYEIDAFTGAIIECDTDFIV